MRTHEVEKYARALLSWNPDFALNHAARRAGLFAAQGDDESAAAWNQIQKRIEIIQAWNRKHPRIRAGDGKISDLSQ